MSSEKQAKWKMKRHGKAHASPTESESLANGSAVQLLSAKAVLGPYLWATRCPAQRPTLMAVTCRAYLHFIFCFLLLIIILNFHITHAEHASN